MRIALLEVVNHTDWGYNSSRKGWCDMQVVSGGTVKLDGVVGEVDAEGRCFRFEGDDRWLFMERKSTRRMPAVGVHIEVDIFPRRNVVHRLRTTRVWS